MPRPSLAFINRSKSYWHGSLDLALLPGEAVSEDAIQPPSQSPALTVCGPDRGRALRVLRHWCRKSPSQLSQKLPSPIPIPPHPGVPSWVVLPQRSCPPLPFCSLVWTAFGRSHYILYFCVFWFCASSATLSCKRLVFADCFPLSMLKGLLSLWKTLAQNVRTSDKMHYKVH